MSNNNSVVKQIRYGFPVFSVTGMLLIAIIITVINAVRIIDLRKEKVEDVSTIAYQNIENYLDDIIRKIGYISRISGLPYMATQNRRNILRAAIYHNSAYQSISLYGISGNLIDEEHHLNHTPPLNVNKTELFYTAYTEHDDYFKTKITSNNTILEIAMPVRDSENNIAGIIYSTVSLAFLDFVVSEAKIKSGITYILDRNGMVIGHSEKHPKHKHFLPKERFKYSKNPTVELTQNENGSWVFKTFKRIGRVHWTVIVELPLMSVMSPLISQTIIILMLTVSMAIMMYLFTAYIASSISNPILLLTNAAKKISERELSTRVSGIDEGEFALLADAFNTMAKDLEKYTEELKIQATLIQESEGKFRRLAENAQDIIFRVNLQEHRYEYVSPAVETITGYSPDDCYKNPDLILEMVSEANKDEMQESRRKMAEGIVEPIISFPIITKEGEEKWLSQRTVSIKDDKGNIVALEGIIRDITKLKNNEKRLEEYAEDLKRSNDELEQFAYAVSHDLQEPLRTISSYVSLITSRYADNLPEGSYDYFSYVINASAHMKSLILALLEYSRVGRDDYSHENINTNMIIEEIKQNLNASLSEANAEIETEVLPAITGNRFMINRLFQNIISNALKFRDKERNLKIKISSFQIQNNMIRFKISDNGIGFDEKQAERIFVIFQRLHTKNEYEGTGIGLAMCKKIVEIHGGNIKAEGREGEGASFIFSLPVGEGR